MKDYLLGVSQQRPPLLLEIGIDRGVSLVPLVAFLARSCPSFGAIGIDIKLQEQVVLMLRHLDLMADQHVTCVEGNSLEVLPKLVSNGVQFDVVLLDGDHNYHTVSREMAFIDDLTHTGSVVICDDYDGRWAEHDLWYAERDGYQDVVHATQRQESTLHGVRPAVDEWLATHPGWNKSKPVVGEPIMLTRIE